MFMEAGRKFPTEEPKVVQDKVEREGGPQLDDVIKSVKIPQMLSPHLYPKKELIEVADEQTAAIGRIADTMVRMADWRIAQDRNGGYLADLQYGVLYSLAKWLKAAAVVQAVSVVLTCIWLLVR